MLYVLFFLINIIKTFGFLNI